MFYLHYSDTWGKKAHFWVGAGFNVTEYREAAAAILAHARAHLSASAMAAHVLRTMGVDDAAARPLLFVTHCTPVSALPLPGGKQRVPIYRFHGEPASAPSAHISLS